ncbi:MAG: hypothetical protein Q8S94_09870 [Pseudohongiella sp.]|nr:hypothetical protein [Pseudohongiella sp.]
MSTDIKQKLLIIHNDGVLLYGWNKSGLIEIGSYNQTTSAIDRFQDQLIENRSAPFIVVVDCIEEDFRHENVVHVTGSDRVALLDRKLAFLFRTTPYRIARIIGREKDGRKDDKALFSALSRTDLVDPWLNLILDQQIAIKSISSAAYLMETFAKQQGLQNHAHLLLVNVEPQTGVRQTYLQKGKVLFSRLSPRSQSQHTGIVQLVQDQAVQTRKYLERIKLLPYELDINTVVFMPQDCQGMDSDDLINHMTYQFRDTRMAAELMTSLSSDIESPGALLLTLGQSLRKSHIPNIYGPFKSRRYFFINQARTALIIAGILAFVSGTVLALPHLSDALAKSEQTDVINARTVPILREYENLRQRFPETPTPSNTMALVVSTYDTVNEQINSPGELMVQVSRALSSSPNIRLTSMEWRLESVIDDAQPEAAFGASDEVLRTSYMRAVLDKRTKLTAIIEGNVEATSSVRTARDQVQGFIDSLESLPDIKVNPITMPINLEPDAALVIQLNGNAVAASFSLALSPEEPVVAETQP